MTAIQALFAFTGWTLTLVMGIFLYRGLRILRGTPITHWTRGAVPDDDIALARRIADAHANCLENLPVFAVLVLVAATQGKLASIDLLAACVFYCRVIQSLMHLWGTGSLQVHLRAIFWAGQLALFVMMFLRLLA